MHYITKSRKPKQNYNVSNGFLSKCLQLYLSVSKKVIEQFKNN